MAKKITYNDTYLAKWIAGEIKDSELKKLISDDDFKAYKELQAGVEVFEYLEASTAPTFSKIKDKIEVQKQPTKKPVKIRFLFAKSMLAMAAAIALFFSISTFLDFRDVSFESDFGEMKTIALLDESEVILNAKSTVSYNKKEWKNKRNVLLTGEAFFKVKKGSTFNVITDHGTVSVLGTQFNVNTQKDFFEVICYEGRVKVVHKNNEYILTPSKSVRIVNDIKTEETLALSAKKPNWILGESNFRSVPLKIVINALEKQFNIKINSNSIDESIVFTGSFNHKDIDIALAAVFKTANITYQIKNNTITLSK
ncbi:FecR family protein [Polaribacter litorisediminis]|uniref:FecR family protein n=1 Tax=Polaribacter litorisediminis TaxID=1908341 RepID=UPI001CC07F72|nr:FecR family protein [Polaribacter litorisediminis]UAM98663.1 FecR family protein [Polaribacter litorisediminis]